MPRGSGGGEGVRTRPEVSVRRPVCTASDCSESPRSMPGVPAEAVTVTAVPSQQSRCQRNGGHGTRGGERRAREAMATSRRARGEGTPADRAEPPLFRTFPALFRRVPPTRNGLSSLHGAVTDD